jgi:hypothetical protein
MRRSSTISISAPSRPTISAVATMPPQKPSAPLKWLANE